MDEYDALEAFKALGLSATTLKALERKGFTEPTDIQRECIPLLLGRNVDVVGQAQTGTGKTAAFALPILEKLDVEDRSTQALVLAPTRELAMQVADEISSLKGDRKISVEAIYGGSSYETQFKKLKKGIQIVVGTPGRIQDHLERGTLDLTHLKFAVLDEADEMLDMGFVEDIEKILSQTNEDKRMLFFSATMPDPILALAVKFMKEYEIVRIRKGEVDTSLTEQYFVALRESDKMEVLTRIIDSCSQFYAIVFCKTKVQCEEIGRKLGEKGYPAEALHGDLSQKQREIILQKMRDHKIGILVATDVAARGIDISELTHVINYTIPGDPEVYTHRIGRTGRAGRTGVAITFVTPSEKRKFAFIKRINKSEIEPYRVPTVADLIQAKKDRMADAVASQMDKLDDAYDDIASTLLSSYESNLLVKALLQLKWPHELERERYNDIRAIEAKEERRGRRERDERPWHDDETEDKDGITRLFFARGRNSHLTKRKLADLIIDACNVRDGDLQDIQVMEDFSFINVPSHLAGRIISTFKDYGEDGKPLVTRARAEQDGRKKKRNDAGRRQVKASGTAFSRRRERHAQWEEGVRFYGRDSYDDYIPSRSASKGRKKEHGKYNTQKRK